MSIKSIKFAVPFFVLGLAVFGCSSSDTPNTGTGGSSAGGKGGTTGSAGKGGGSGTVGTGGSGGATGGSGGATGGSGGATGGSAGSGNAGHGGSGGGTAGSGGTTGTGGAGGAQTAAEIKTTYCGTTDFGMNGTGVFTPTQFCTLYLATCTGNDAAPGYTTMQSCENMFGAVTTQAHCRSYHLCNATGTGQAATHCPHATGMNGQCQ